MVVRPILVVGNPVLRQKARRVSLTDGAFQRLVDDMIETMRAAPGVGLAAPQVGVPLRLAVIEVEERVTVLVNPEITRRSAEVDLPDEGCLSVPGYWGRLERHVSVSVRARDRHGKELRIANAAGLFAQALQHEIDHLDGLLYVDRLGPDGELRREEPPRKREVDEEEARAREVAAGRHDGPTRGEGDR